MRLLLFLLTATVVHAASIAGKVVGVHDGDTLTVLTAAKESVKVRLYGIDAPESKQAFGARAKQELSELAFAKDARVDVQSKDRYGRTVGRVFVGPVDVNAEMVKRGFAWWYKAYAKKDSLLDAAERAARKAGAGLWADKAPVAPWDFRKAAAASKNSSSTSRKS
jgi:endonuclease YncB( thermonuclease family)